MFKAVWFSNVGKVVSCIYTLCPLQKSCASLGYTWNSLQDQGLHQVVYAHK